MTAPVPPVVPAPDASGQVQNLLNQIFNSSNWRGEVEKTLKKNVRLQGVIKAQKEQLDRFTAKGFNLETGELKEGRLLSKDEAAQFQLFLDLKLKPEDVKKMSEEHSKFAAKEAERLQEEQFADAAEALGYENIPALTRWLTREKLVLEFKDQRVDETDESGEKTGKKKLVRMPYVRPAEDEKAALSPLEDYIEEQVPEFVDVFKIKPGSEDEEDGGADSGTDDANDEEFVRRASSEASRRVHGGKGGVKVPATRSASSSNSGGRDKKGLEKMEQEARINTMYGI